MELYILTVTLLAILILWGIGWFIQLDAWLYDKARELYIEIK